MAEYCISFSLSLSLSRVTQIFITLSLEITKHLCYIVAFSNAVIYETIISKFSLFYSNSSCVLVVHA